MDAIGGYFSLELPKYEEYHKNAVRLNTGRNCLEYVLRLRHYGRIYIPYYTCRVVLEPFEKLKVDYAFYHINYDYEITDDIKLGDGEALLYTNYYGLKNSYVNKLAEQFGNRLIVDNTQAFYAQLLPGIDTFNTCRKFFGVPDGAYLYTDMRLDGELEQDLSFCRMTFLTKRIDISAEAAYADFREESACLKDNPIRKMSALTQRLMSSIDYRKVAGQRRHNYKRLHDALSSKNKMVLELDETSVPMVYPYYVDNGVDLRNHLIENRIYVARYWQNVLDWTDESMTEHRLALNVLPLPIDQRYGDYEMDYIIDHILHF